MRTSYLKALSAITGLGNPQEHQPDQNPADATPSEPPVKKGRKRAAAVPEPPLLKVRKVKTTGATPSKPRTKPQTSGCSSSLSDTPSSSSAITNPEKASQEMSKRYEPLPAEIQEWLNSYQLEHEKHKISRSETIRQSITKGYTLGNGVYAAQSTKPGAGNGLFAEVSFQPGEIITECPGRLESFSSAKQLSQSYWQNKQLPYSSWSHLVELSDHEVFHCEKEATYGSGGGGYANDSRPQKPNAQFYRINDERSGTCKVFLKALCNITVGEEVFVSYGEGYWLSFKQAFPETYERIFGEDLFNQDLKLNDKDSKLSIVHWLNENKPVPNWPELKSKPAAWDLDLCTYALYKYHKIPATELTSSALKLLKADSGEYFQAFGQYCAFMKTSSPHTVNSSRKAQNRNQPFLSVPLNGVFRDDMNYLASAHFHVLSRIFNPERYKTIDTGKDSEYLTRMLKVLNPASPHFEACMTEYLFKRLNTGIRPND